MTRSLFAIVAATSIFVACDAGLADPEETVGPVAGRFLNEALDTMELNSIKRFEIEWVPFREQAFEDALGAVTTADAYPAIVAALERIGDNHSFFRGAGARAALSPGLEGHPGPGSSVEGPVAVEDPAAVEPMAGLLPSDIGYLDVPEFQGGGVDGDVLATEYHRLIESVDTLVATCRWVVDLRGNQGGNMWPMLAGVGPILGEGEVGAFVYPDSVVTPWTYENGRAGIDGGSINRSTEPYSLESPFPFVAVLTDSLTASSGEAIAAAFRGREGARSFGEATWGVSTANQAFPLSDLSVIFLTVAAVADRAGTVYGQELVPDELVAGGSKTGDPETDAVLGAAVEWLSGQVCG
jgi:carboxyl-terminal processing protease